MTDLEFFSDGIEYKINCDRWKLIEYSDSDICLIAINQIGNATYSDYYHRITFLEIND